MKLVLRALIAVLAVALFFSVAFAAFTGPFYDTFVIVNNTNNPSAPNLAVQDSTSSCTDAYITYIQFDATNIGTVSTATLTLKVGGTPSGLNNSPTLTLYGVADFDPATLNGANYPSTAGAFVIQNKTISSGTAAGTVVEWGGADTGLKTYIQSQADNDNKVTLALSFSVNCFEISSLSFYSQDWGTPEDRPVLTITGTNTNAVTLRTFRADDPAVSLVILGGAAIVLLVAMAGIFVIRRRRLAS
jgi:hypothetical protein